MAILAPVVGMLVRLDLMVAGGSRCCALIVSARWQRWTALPPV
jgi:hypothetical protein